MAQRFSSPWFYAGLGAGTLLLTCCCLGGIVGGYFAFMGPPADRVLAGPFPLEDKSTWNWWDARIEVSDGLKAPGSVRYKAYTVALQADTIYVIDLLQNRADSDPYLVLHDPDGKKVAANNDGGAGLNAKIVYNPTRDGQHRILAATLKGLGDFTLKIQEFDETLRGPLPIVQKGAWSSGDPLADFSAEFKFIGKVAFRAYKVPFKAGTTYEIQLQHNTGTNPKIALQDPDGKLVSGKTTRAADLQMICLPAKEGVHRILVATSGPLGPFTLKVQEYAEPKAPAPAPKPPVPTDRGKVLTLPAVEMDHWSKQDPIHPFLLSPVKTYTVKLKASKAYTIDLVTRQKGQDPFLILTDAFGQMLAQDDDGGGYPNARIVFTPTVDGEYRILATTMDHGLGPYTLSVREGQ